MFCCPALELFHCLTKLFHCLPLLTTVSLPRKKLQNARNTYAHSKPQLLRALFQSPRAWNLLPRSLHIIDSDLYLEFIFITSPFFICYHYKARNIHLYELCNGKNGVPNCIHQTMQNEVRFLLNSHVHQWLYEVTQPFNDQKTCLFFKKIPVWVVTVFRLACTHISTFNFWPHTNRTHMQKFIIDQICLCLVLGSQQFLFVIHYILVALSGTGPLPTALLMYPGIKVNFFNI